MLDLSPDKILMLGLVALVVLGPNRLPQAARSLGRFMGQLRAFTSSMQTELRDAIDPDNEISAAITELRPRNLPNVPSVSNTVRRAVTDTLSPPPPPDRPGGAAAGSPSPLASGRRDLNAPARTPEDPTFN